MAIAMQLAAISGLATLLAGSSASTSAADAITAAPAAVPPKVASTPAATNNARLGALTPDEAAWLTRLAQRTTDASAAGDLFATHSWYVAPPPPPPPPPAAAVAPTAPPLPFGFVGSYAPQGSDAVYFLVKGDRVYDVKPGDTIDGTYTFDGVDNGQLNFTYKPLMIRQTLSVGGGT